MTQPELAALAVKLASLAASEQRTELGRQANFAGVALSQELRRLCYEAWVGEPAKTKRIISAMITNAEISGDEQAAALAQWALGIGEILAGRMRAAISFFDKSEFQLSSLRLDLEAAETQVAKIYALAMLGEYDAAVSCGLRVREVFLANGATLAAGKIEHNLGNLYQRRDQYDRAEHFLRLAHARYLEAGDVLRLIQTDNSLANALAHLHRFDDAESIYREALARASAASLDVTQAEIESNLGHLLLFEGRFDESLRYFESSHRRYQQMAMPHQTAIAERELADVYLEFNLAPESAAIYQRVERVFAELELTAEHAVTLANFARSCLLAGEHSEARELLAASRSLYEREQNFVGAASVALTEARLRLSQREFSDALGLAENAEKTFTDAGIVGRALDARWIRGEALRQSGELFAAREFLRSALQESNDALIRHISLRCLTSLGLAEVAAGQSERAGNYFRRAIDVIEKMRAPLPAEDFRTAFIADKLTPYLELTRLLIMRESDEATAEAFLLSENARSRVLFEQITTGIELSAAPESVAVNRLRTELNWLYKQLQRVPLEPGFDPARLRTLQEQIRSREDELLELNRLSAIATSLNPDLPTAELDLSTLRNALSDERALIEYIIVDEQVAAFVLTSEGLTIRREIAPLKTVTDATRRLRFQLDSQRASGRDYAAISRTRYILAELYDQLLRPVEDLVEWKNLIFAPTGILNQIPFHALFDGFGYIVEAREVSYTPSARLLSHCLQSGAPTGGRMVIVGVSDQFAPQIDREVAELADHFPAAEVLINEKATVAAVKDAAARAGIVHFACHGIFRPDNPLFSALSLADGRLTVRDAAELDLRGSLVVLSACDSGQSEVRAGDELFGLARGFFAAGAKTMILSQWPVNDHAAGRFMESFYDRLRHGIRPAAAVRFAQLDQIRANQHPFDWAPFITVGSF